MRGHRRAWLRWPAAGGDAGGAWGGAGGSGMERDGSSAVDFETRSLRLPPGGFFRHSASCGERVATQGQVAEG